MKTKKNAKPSEKQPFIAVIPSLQADKTFYLFIDKHPLYADNTIDAAYDLLLERRKKPARYKTHVDETYEDISFYFKTSRFSHRHK